MSVSTWVETVPSSTSQVGNYPSWARTTWAAVASGMAVEHYYEGSGGASTASSGDLNPGGSRAFFDVKSNSSAPGSQTTGRLFLASDVSRLFVYDSTGTYMVGTAFGIEVAADPATPGFWARQTGSYTTTDSSGNTDVTFPVSFTAFPTITQSVTAASAHTIFLGIVHTQSGSTKFRSVWSSIVAPGSFTVSWMAMGPISSASY